ncbi:dUTP diphosphatase [Curtobacterium sp. RRHDQ10]|uniref:dUTP diphosphatase n=1 Tax=Curtobacterium phyllosphaerae TaxID=3413379 RepID=UPI003BEFE06F
MTETVDVLWTGQNAPDYAHPGDAGADLVSAESLVLAPGERRLVGTGLRIALPDGHAAFVVPRSGLAAKHGITIVNAPGTIDAGYRGEVKVALLNTDATEPYTIAVGDRIAQMIVLPVPRVRFVPVDALPESVRGDGGFGSSGYGATPERGATPEDQRGAARDDQRGAARDQDHEGNQA